MAKGQDKADWRSGFDFGFSTFIVVLENLQVSNSVSVAEPSGSISSRVSISCNATLKKGTVELIDSDVSTNTMPTMIYDRNSFLESWGKIEEYSKLIDTLDSEKISERDAQLKAFNKVQRNDLLVKSPTASLAYYGEDLDFSIAATWYLSVGVPDSLLRRLISDIRKKRVEKISMNIDWQYSLVFDGNLPVKYPARWGLPRKTANEIDALPLYGWISNIFWDELTEK